jgi:hypothetical protein
MGLWFAGSFIGGRWHGCLMSAWLVPSRLYHVASVAPFETPHIGRGGLFYHPINFPEYHNGSHESLDALTISRLRRWQVA